MSTIEATKVRINAATRRLWLAQGGLPELDGWTEDTIKEAVRRVNNGAKLLDQTKPGWEEKVVPAKLDMSSGAFCIIGQAYGDYDQVAIPFGVAAIEGNENGEFDDVAIEHGFLSQDEHGRDEEMPYSLLDRVWVYLLSERAERGTPCTLAWSA